tara:strand:- start:2359 stop:3015 length:657 start_codon:yes stop_codon:yes gene_type:complete
MSTTRRTRVFGTGFRKMGKFKPVLKYRSKKKITPMPVPEKIAPVAQVTLTDGVNVAIEKDKFTLSKGEISLTRKFPPTNMNIEHKDNNLIFTGKSSNSRVRAIIGSFRAHTNNMLKGLEEPFVYKLKITSVHFPMTAKLENNKLELKNFLGGKQLRVAEVPQGVDVKLSGDIIEISARDIELAGITATRFEQLTRVSKRDRRVFQDGIFITEKPGKIL